MAYTTLPAPQGVQLSEHHLTVLRSMLEEQRTFRLEQLAQLHLPGPAGPLSSTDPEIFIQVPKIAGASAASALCKTLMASPVAIPPFCMPTSTAIVRHALSSSRATRANQ